MLCPETSYAGMPLPEKEDELRKTIEKRNSRRRFRP